ncbi:increased DNA methylation 2-like isoform X1 [Vigna umbellata]|uniref:increased DNA methylation 2-like isoform X1 n=1 Tax=Vigna umbellata TaxID=87088 RepID=UPI001F5FA205|nr:increased DNA methylation 2-like isoform X1 [Vigna umbellata]
MVSEADEKNVMPNDDQCFLVYFIVGTYFGPDIKSEGATKKSILQRVAEGFPPYTLNQLTNSFVKVAELERVYYYILRKSDKSLILKISFLRRFFQGQGGNSNYPHFLDLFPPHLHPQSRFQNLYNIVHNIVFINNPDIRYIKPEDVARFKRLSGVEELHVDRDAVRLQLGASSLDNCVLNNSNMSMGKNENEFSGGFYKFRDNVNGRVRDATSRHQGGDIEDEVRDDPEEVGAAMLLLPTPPSREELSDMVAATKNGFALTGSVAKAQFGPSIGLLDIGECEDSYLFRVSLPGVKRDEKEFYCDVETDGKVMITGVTITGETTVYRYSHAFEMQTQNLCPPGQFTLSFRLPGPVDPHHFSVWFQERRVNSNMNISHALANMTGASADIILTSSSAFIIFFILAKGRLWFLKSVTFSIS